MSYFGNLKCNIVSTNGCFRPYIYLGTNKTLIQYYLYIFDNWAENIQPRNVELLP